MNCLVKIDQPLLRKPKDGFKALVILILLFTQGQGSGVMELMNFIAFFLHQKVSVQVLAHGRCLDISCDYLLIHPDSQKNIYSPPTFRSPNHGYVSQEKFECLCKQF